MFVECTQETSGRNLTPIIEEACKIDIDKVITIFATKHPRRMKLVNILED